jgi:hypothetical protein
MAALSVQNESGVFVGCASPIYLASQVDMRKGAKLIFEVLEADASILKQMVRQVATFGLGTDQPPFVAEVTSVVGCASTASGLEMLRDRPTVRCVLTIHGAINLQQQH